MSGNEKLGVLAVVALLFAWVIYRARRNNTGREILAGGLLLLLNIFGPVIKSPQQTTEESRDAKGRSGQSGEPQ